MFRFYGFPLNTLAILCASGAFAQSPTGAVDPVPGRDRQINELQSEVDQLKSLVRQLQDQVSTLAGERIQPPAAGVPPPAAGVPPPAAGVPGVPAAAGTSTAAAPPSPHSVDGGSISADVLHGFTLNALLDGYYEYNLNSPVGRINNLRAYDVSSNSFSLNQADIVLESAPDLAANKRYGMRLDLQFGQATSTLQGNPVNELRPAVYRDIFQAYGTYVFPVAGGLTVDFGKWASSLGIEGNYTKDQLNYSRSFWFDYLPFYHEGIRSKLAINDEVALNVWITNGTNQTEAFNNYKDQLYGVVITPTPTTNWTLSYYRGQEHPDVLYLNTEPPGQNLPIQQGTYVQPIINPPNGRLDIIDSYVTWTAVHNLTLAAEVDYVQERLYSYSSPQRVQGGAVYAAYQFTPTLAAAARGEYLADIGGLYSGVTQYLKEQTLTFDYRPGNGFLLRAEFRRDYSNEHYFLSHTLGNLLTSQPTVALGLVWWFGQKEGTW